MKRAGSFQSEPPTKEQMREDNEHDGPKDECNLPQFPPVVLQKIASMLDDGVNLKFRDRFRFASVNRQMNAVVRGGIDKMERRRMIIQEWRTGFKINDITFINHQPMAGYTQKEHIGALLAFARPNHIHFRYQTYLENGPIAEWILTSIPPSSILELDLCVKIKGVRRRTAFYRVMTTIGKMTNLKSLAIDCNFDRNRLFAIDHKNSSPSVPKGSPFLELLKLHQLRTLRLRVPALLTEAQRADLFNRSPSNITTICDRYSNLDDPNAFNELLASIDDKVCANITTVCCLHLDNLGQLPDQLQVVVEHLPQCTNIFALWMWCIPDRRTIDKIGGRLLESAVAYGDRLLAVRIGVDRNEFEKHVTVGGLTEFTYERNSAVVQVSLVLRRNCLCAGFAVDCYN